MSQLKELTDSLQLPSFTAKQIAQWLYKKRVKSISEMTNLSKAVRERLGQEYEVGRVAYCDKVVSADGTRKYLFPMDKNGDGKLRGVEAVMIPDEERFTICVSSQVGCRMGCRFCMTGRQGFHGNLSTGDIISQFLEIDESDLLTNAVFMGMGEPLDNWDNVLRAIEILTSDWGFGWSPKRITLSTIGVNSVPGGDFSRSPLKRFLDECSCHLAVSLHDPFPEERGALMPMEKAYPLEDTLDLIKQYDFTGQRRVSFEYIMFSGVNDSKRHAFRLANILHGMECRVNLIRFHKIPDSELSPSPMPIIEMFRDRLSSSGIITTIRASRGEDILAACGMLSGRDKKN